jgi:hypothetical protein
MILSRALPTNVAVLSAIRDPTFVDVDHSCVTQTQTLVCPEQYTIGGIIIAAGDKVFCAFGERCRRRRRAPSSLRFLDREEPDLEEVRDAASLLVTIAVFQRLLSEFAFGDVKASG